MPSLEGKVAIVTGARRGIGREHALALARAGAKVVVNDLGVSLAGEGGDDMPAQEVVSEIAAAGGKARASHDDVADFSAAERMINETVDGFGRLDILVNNAGITRDRMLVNMTEDEWDAVLHVHLKGHFAPTRHAATYWRERSKAGEDVRGRVINTSSPSGVFGNVGQANYGAAKAGIAAFTVIAAQELARYGVTVNCLAPNARTRMTEAAFGEIPKPEDGFDVMDPANIAPVVVALCADEAQDITGQCFFVHVGAVCMLRPWDAGEVFVSDKRWEADALLAQLRDRFPHGAAPEGMAAGMEKAGGRSLLHRRPDGPRGRRRPARGSGHADAGCAHAVTQLTVEELAQGTERDLGESSWHEIEQRHIDLFAEATGDHQWIHVDPVRAAAGPFGTTVAHGFLTLALLPEMSASAMEVRDTRMGVNYGLNKVRFTAPVPVGSRLRGRFKLLSYEPIEGGAQLTMELTVEREGSAKPVCIAESIARRYI